VSTLGYISGVLESAQITQLSPLASNLAGGLLLIGGLLIVLALAAAVALVGLSITLGVLALARWLPRC
jgi:hypothetical protein